MAENVRIGALSGMSALFMAVTQTLFEAGVIKASDVKEVLAQMPRQDLGPETSAARDAVIEKLMEYLSDPERGAWVHQLVRPTLPKACARDG